jgi:Zn-dependent peptidase ImmA (M78 family)
MDAALSIFKIKDDLMRVPTKITVLGRTFKIKKTSVNKIRGIVGADAAGALDYSKRIIYIAEELTIEDQKLTLLHELVHCIEICTGLAQITESSVREVWCESIASGFYDIIKQIK